MRIIAGAYKGRRLVTTRGSVTRPTADQVRIALMDTLMPWLAGARLLDLYAGFHQGFLTYGAAIDLWIVRVSGTIYKEEMGAYVKQDTESRMSLRVDLKMDF